MNGSEPRSIEAQDNYELGLDEFLIESDTAPPEMVSPEKVEQEDAKVMAGVGVNLKEDKRSGTFILQDFHPLSLAVKSDKIELLPIAHALKKYEWLRQEYYWKALPAELDKYTTQSASVSEPAGYFLRVNKGAILSFPVQTALYITQSHIAQRVHNIVILEEGSTVHLITGCATGCGVSRAAHLGASEYYIGPNARLTGTMIHSWGPEVEVRPRSGTIVEEGGVFVSNYVSLRTARSIQSEPLTWLNGKGASAKYLSIITGSGGSTIDIGGKVYLNAEGTSAELAHRAICTGGRIYQRGLLVGNAPCRAHVDCSGIVLNAGNEGFIQSVPGLIALHPEARMSHEASIGKIAPKQVEYLQSRGMDEREAISLIIRGFIGADIIGLGPELDSMIAEISELAGHGEK